MADLTARVWPGVLDQEGDLEQKFADSQQESADLDDIESDESIFELAGKCEVLFEKQILNIYVRDDQDGSKLLVELKQRFVAWAASLGIFAESRLSSDHTLRHPFEIEDQLLRLLDILQRNLAHLFVPDQAPDDVNTDSIGSSRLPSSHPSLSISSLEAISEAIDRLNSLGNVIQRSSLLSQPNKVRGFAEDFHYNSFENVGRDYPLLTQASDPFPYVPGTNRYQQGTSIGWTGDNTTHGTSVNGTMAANPPWICNINSPRTLPAEPSQLLENESTRQPDHATESHNTTEPNNTTEVSDADLSHRRGSTRNTGTRDDTRIMCKWNGCTYAGVFARQADLWRHIRSIHLHPMAFPCPVAECGKSFGRRDKLQDHLRAQHGGMIR